jgi:hypothetical protein
MDDEDNVRPMSFAESVKLQMLHFRTATSAWKAVNWSRFLWENEKRVASGDFDFEGMVNLRV